MIERVVEKIIPYELIIHPGETLADILKERGILYDEAAVCPVAREIPEKIKKELDEYLARKRKEQ